MKRKKEKIILIIGILSLLISTFFIKEDFGIFLFLFIIFSICLIQSRKDVLRIIGKPIIREIVKLNDIKVELQENVTKLKKEYNEVINSINNKQTYINEINKYIEKINKLKSKEKQMNIELIKLEDKKRNIEQIVRQEEIINRAIDREEKNFNLLSEENNKLESRNNELNTELIKLNRKIIYTKNKIDFMNKCNLNYIDRLEGFEFEKICAELLEIDGYEKTQATQEVGDYGIDVIAEKDGIKYAIQCKRYDGNVGNEAIQEAMTGKEYYQCNIAIVLTNSKFTNRARRLAESAGVILWDRAMLNKIIERNKCKILNKTLA